MSTWAMCPFLELECSIDEHMKVLGSLHVTGETGSTLFFEVLPNRRAPEKH